MKVGDTVYYDNKPATVIELTQGEYGERVTFQRGESVITTTPGLDARFDYGKRCVKCNGTITTPLLGDQEERCVRCADYDPDDPDIAELEAT